MIRRLLIANRGEIARRIARTCRRLGIEFVAVYSDPDAASPHLQGAVASARVGPAPAAESYLNRERLLEAAVAHRCDAVHPGYGFLSESASFADAVVKAGLTFVGPSAGTIATLGDKARAKALMIEARVPVVPGIADATESVEALVKAAQAVGYPVLLKPSAGGGGKGMQVVRDEASMPESAQRAMRLAQANFGDARLIVERYVERPRHIEVQVFGDSYGNIVHLFERECSLQRRHQKVVEEAPAPRLAPHLRQELHEAAVRGARAIGYVNAGTFEFIVGAEGDIHFLEVNTRLQVEHPVTEAITGIDLVEWQLRVASGERLPMLQPEITPRGHAFECRIYAEDPDNEFRPAPGKALHVGWPTGARVEAGIESGGEVSAFYDPMVGKLVTHGTTREESLERMREAVRTTAILGLTTNLGYLRELLSDDDVAEGNVHTRYLDERRMSKPSGTSACAVAAALSVRPSHSAAWPWSPGSGIGAFDRAWLSPGSPLGKLWFLIGQDVLEAALTHYAPDEAVVEIAGATYAVKMLDDEGSRLHHGTIGDVTWYATPSEDFLEVALGGIRHRIERYGERVLAQHASVESAVAPMPGIVVALSVKAGDAVRTGDVLVVVESMKMENQIRAASDGKVTQVNCQLNETVAAGQVLVSVEPASL